jgi:hypothetical protein
MVVEAFEPDVVQASAPGRGDQGSRRHAVSAGENTSSNAKIPAGVSAEVRRKLADDYQLRVSYETAIGWLNKQSQ